MVSAPTGGFTLEPQQSALTQSVLQAHNNRVSEVADEAAVIQRLGGGASDEVAAVDPHHDGQQVWQRRPEVHVQRDKDVEIETVLTDLRGHERTNSFQSAPRSYNNWDWTVCGTWK